MNFLIHSNSINNILDNLQNNTISKIEENPKITNLDKMNFNKFYNFANILSVIDNGNQVFYIRNKDKDEYYKLEFLITENLNLLENNFNDYNNLVKHNIEIIKKKYSLVNQTDFNGENDVIKSELSDALRKWENDYNLSKTKRNEIETNMISEYSALSNRLLKLKLDNKNLYNELFKCDIMGISESPLKEVDLETLISKEKELLEKQKLEYQKKIQLLELKENEFEEKNKKYETNREIIRKTKQLLKEETTKYDTLLEERNKDKKELKKQKKLLEASNSEDAKSQISETIKKLESDIKEKATVLHQINDFIDKETTMYNKVVNENRQIKKEYNLIDEEKEQLEEIKKQIDAQERLLNTMKGSNENQIYMNLLNLKETYDVDELAPFSFLMKEMNENELKIQRGKFMLLKQQFIRNNKDKSDELEEDIEELDIMKKSLIDNKKTLETGRIKLNKAMQSESAVNPKSEKERLKNEEILNQYKLAYKKLEERIKGLEEDIKEKDKEIQEKQNTLEKSQKILDDIEEILFLNTENALNKVGKNRNHICLEKFKTLLEKIRENKETILEIIKEMMQKEKMINYHISNCLTYNMGNVYIKPLTRKDMIELIMNVSSKSKTPEKAEMVLDKQIKKLSLKGGFGYNLEFIDELSNEVHYNNLNYKKIKKQMKQSITN